MLHPQETALLQSLVRAGRLTQDNARAFAQALEQRRAAGERPSLVEALVARRVATADEIARAIKPASDRIEPPPGAGSSSRNQKYGGGPPPPFLEPEAPTMRVGLATPPPGSRVESFINVPDTDNGRGVGRPPTRPAFPTPTGMRPATDPGALSNFGRSGAPQTRPQFPAPMMPPSSGLGSRPNSGTSESETISDPESFPGMAGRQNLFGSSGLPGMPGGLQASQMTGGSGMAASGPMGGPMGGMGGPMGGMGGPMGAPPMSGAGTGAGQAAQGAVGAFILETKVGEGTLGDVWKAKHTRQRRTVAVKVFRPASLAPSELDRLLAEARTASRVRHPNIISVHEVGKLPDGRSYVAMDFVDGPSLAQTLESRTLGAAEVARIGAKIASALQAAHEQGIVHGDVKPHNILLDDRSEPFVGDFGLAREDGEEKKDGVRFRGTPGYCAPEQISSAPTPSPQSDVFALGATLYHCLTRKAPFAGDSPLAAAKATLKGRPTRPTKVEPTVPPELEAVIMKALDRDPEKRYANAATLGEDLRRFLDGRPLEAKPIGAFSGSTGIVLAVLAALVVILGGAAAVLVYRKMTLENHVKVLDDLETRGEYADLEAKARALMLERPDESRAPRYLALSLVGQHKLPDAVDAAKKAVELSVEGTEDLVVSGIVNLAADKQEDAKAAFDKVLARKPLTPLVEARASAGAACIEALTDGKAAIEKATRALELAPEDFAVQALAGRALLLCRDCPKALEALKKAVATRPKDENVLTDKALAVAGTGDTGGAITDLDQALAQRADHVPALVARARLKLANGESSTAGEDADKARTIDPTSRDAQLVAAIAQIWQSRLDDADSRVQELVKLAPSALTTAVARALLSLARGKPDDAYITLRDATPPAKREHGLLVVALRALALKASLRPEEARSEADQLAKTGASPDALWLTPADDDALVSAFKRRLGFSTPESSGHALKAEALYNLGKLAEAKSEVEAAKRGAPPAPRTFFADGLLQLAATPPDTSGALRTADTAIQSNPDLAELRQLRAMVRLQTNALALALSDIDAAVKLEPTNYFFHFLRGQIRLKMNDAGSALTELDQADRLAPRTQPMICALRAQILANTQRYAEAKKAAEKGLVIDPRNVDCLFFRGVARCLLNEERYDDDFQAALASPQGAQRIDIVFTRLEFFLRRGRADAADKVASDMLSKLPAPGSNPQVENLRLQLTYVRLCARAFLPDQWKAALEEVSGFLAKSPDQPDFLALRGFLLAATQAQGVAEDAKKVASSPPQVFQGVFGRGQQAAQLKIPGDWPAFYVALAEVVQQKELKLNCYKVLATVFQIREQKAESLVWLKKIQELVPNDENLKRAIEQLEASEKK